jgi:hypothetical protein
MHELKRAPRRASSIIFNKALTMWIRCASRPWKESRHAKKSKEHRCLAQCCRGATLDQEILIVVADALENTATGMARLGQ